jgi:hypothetical protein
VKLRRGFRPLPLGLYLRAPDAGKHAALRALLTFQSMLMRGRFAHARETERVPNP